MAFTDKVVNKADFEKMDKEYQDLLIRVLTIQCDCEIGGPNIYVPEGWTGHRAPSEYDLWKMGQTATEEVDHFRKMNALLNDLGHDATWVVWRPRDERYVDAFRAAMPTWGDVAVFGFLMDRVGRYQLEEFVDCSYQPLSDVLPDIMREEVGHVNYGTAQLVKLAKTPEGKDEAQAALDRWYPLALDSFGQSESKRSERYINWGLKRRTNGEQRQQFIDEVKPLIDKMGLRQPDPEAGRKFF
ncbi:MAG TPA: Phenylacetic acid catabolic protein [Chloroflexota bacterium]|jgi:ring-1,2-phenylacetyl-CoA epoxidase subunit PaaA